MKEIIINSPTHGNRVALVDDEDYDYINQWKWQLKKHRKTFYAHRTKYIIGGKGKKDHFKMHRVIMKVTNPEQQIDHIDHNGLNCQKYNMRIVTNAQNKKNASSKITSTSKYLGVYVIKNKNGEPKYYGCQININNKSTNIGSFPYTPDGEVAAAKAYDEMAKKHFGEFANPNFKQ